MLESPESQVDFLKEWSSDWMLVFMLQLILAYTIFGPFQMFESLGWKALCKLEWSAGRHLLAH